MEKITLICTPLRFYTKLDEELLFGWLKNIKCIKSLKGIGKELHLYIESNSIPNDDLLNLMGVFDRYKFDANQLKVFMNEKNKDWFEHE